MQKRLTLISFLSQINPIHALTFRICTTGTQPLPKEVLHVGKSSASYFNFQYPLVPLMSSSSCLPLLPRISVTRTIPYIFRSVTCFRRQFVRKVLPVRLVIYIYIYIYIMCVFVSVCVCLCVRACVCVYSCCSPFRIRSR